MTENSLYSEESITAEIAARLSVMLVVITGFQLKSTATFSQSEFATDARLTSILKEDIDKHMADHL